MNKIITFIIPAYNAQKHLNKCLDSFIVEKYIECIEVIVVDDGSTDETAQIANKYVHKYPQTFRIISKENGGHGSTINVGSALARGKYIKVIDSDDWIITANLDKFIATLSEVEAQVILTPYHTVDNLGNRIDVWDIFCSEFNRKYSLYEIITDWRAFENAISFHGITYRSTFYREHGISLVEHVFYEDQEYATIPFCKATSIFPLNIALYQYRIGDPCQSIAPQNQARQLQHLEAVIKHMLQYYENQKNWEISQKNFFTKKLQAIILNYYKVCCVLSPDRKKGRKACYALNNEIFKKIPILTNTLKIRWIVYLAFSLLKINEQQYNRLLGNSTYKKLLRKY